MKSQSKKIIIAGILLLLAGAAVYYFLTRRQTSYIEVETVTVKSGDVTTMVTATGTIEPITVVEVGTQVSGVVERIYIDFNSLVKRGQLIAELDKTNLLAAVTQAQALYDNALNEQQYHQKMYDRQKQLYDNRVISHAEYDLVLYNLNNTKGIVIQRRSELNRAKTNLSYANIYSPISGVVLSKNVDEGQTVAASLNTPTLFTIAQDLKEMQVEANVDEADIGEVKNGQMVTFTVDSYQGEEFSGTITQVRLNPTTTSNVVTYTVVVKADNSELKLKPGMTASITIYTLELKNIIILEAKAANYKMNEILLAKYFEQLKRPFPKTPLKASGKNQKLIYLLENDEPKPALVKLGVGDGVNIEVIEGIKPGDKVVYNIREVSDAKSSGSKKSPFMPTMPGRKR